MTNHRPRKIIRTNRAFLQWLAQNCALEGPFVYVNANQQKRLQEFVELLASQAEIAMPPITSLRFGRKRQSSRNLTEGYRLGRPFIGRLLFLADMIAASETPVSINSDRLILDWVQQWTQGSEEFIEAKFTDDGIRFVSTKRCEHFYDVAINVKIDNYDLF